MKSPLLTACLENLLVCDGGMGTELMALGLPPGSAGMLWNRNDPEHVRSVQEAYANSGCQILTTNSFGGTRSMLSRHDLGRETVDLNRRAAMLAREAAGPGGYVFGDVGPFGGFLEPSGDTTREELETIFAEQITALLTGNIDAVLVETMSDPAEAEVAVRAAKKQCDLPVAVTFAFQKSADGFRTMMGRTAAEAVRAAIDAGADIVGANCGTDLTLDDYILLAGVLTKCAEGTPVLIQPNAGAPISTPTGVSYQATPDEMADCARALRDGGVAIIGGCCGTTPRHMQAIVQAVK